MIAIYLLKLFEFIVLAAFAVIHSAVIVNVFMTVVSNTVLLIREKFTPEKSVLAFLLYVNPPLTDNTATVGPPIFLIVFQKTYLN